MSTEAAAGFQVAVDLGDAFADCVIRDPASERLAGGRVVVRRTDPAASVLAAVTAAAESLGVPIAEVLAGAGRFLHGFAVTTSALGGGESTRVAYVTTLGPEDAPALGLVARERTIRVVERIGDDGRVVIALTDGAIADVLAQVRAGRVQAVALCLRRSALAPAHERRVAEELRRVLPNVYVSASIELAPPVLGEDERGITTALNAHLGPPVRAYLGRVERLLRQGGLAAPVLLMTATGALVTPAAARARPVALIEGGPAGVAFAVDPDPDVRLQGASARAALLSGRHVQAAPATPPPVPRADATGAGDPLRRAPDLVAGDVRAGRCSPADARLIYAVVLTPAGAVDGAATAACRDAVRAERLAGSVPASELLERYGAEGILSGLGG